MNNVSMMSAQYDYSNLIKVYLLTGVAAREPVPSNMIGLAPESLADLSEFGITDIAFWPEDNQTALELGEYQRYGDETLTPDYARKVVVSLRPVIAWTAEEIEADMVLRRAQAVVQSNADADAFYRGYMGRRAAELAVVERVAREFAANGYAGTVPQSVQAVMTTNSTGEPQSAQWAADDIIAQADARNAVMESIYATRNARQAEMRAAAASVELNAAVSAWTGFVDSMCSQLGVVRRYDN